MKLLFCFLKIESIAIFLLKMVILTLFIESNMSELNDNVQQNKTSLIYKGFSLPHQINWLAK
ncbi:hypothetical protein EAY15_19425 [Vibrio anguillarum]|nr:hypothetical protein CLI14_06800 [Vibrio anguillarum]MBF4259651.1 hypothetical protein [Vibrio anguillarum]MBF4285820.1 hypothetical protein [Vibrio anguillarum]MBF4302559.1 hypothetical protein [Vibrio anguillarum]MBF4400718.1 hypothetical protein [Vibrio anguillarum]